MRSFIGKNLILIICVVAGLNIALTSYTLIKINKQNKVYTIGVNRLTDSFTKSLNNTTMTQAQQSAQVINFANGLEQALLEFRAKGKVLLMEEAVLSGGVDITTDVVARIKKGMDK